MSVVRTTLILLKYWIECHYHTNACAPNVTPEHRKNPILRALRHRVTGYASMHLARLLYNPADRQFELWATHSDGVDYRVDAWPIEPCDCPEPGCCLEQGHTGGCTSRDGDTWNPRPIGD